MSKLFTTVLPSLFAGALLFGSALTGAQPAPPAPPAPPAAAIPAPAPRPPKPPKPPKIKGDIHVDLGHLDEMVDQQIENALDQINDNEQIPPNMRTALKARLEKLRVKVKKRLDKMSPADMEALGEELGKMGDEIGAEMDDFGKEMEKFGKDFEKQLEKQMAGKHAVVLKGRHATVIADDSDDDVPTIDPMDDMDDLDDAVKDLGNLKLAPSQKAQLKQLRAKSEQDVARAKADLDRSSEALRNMLESGNASDDQIKRAIDDVSRAEADIRKARILTWVKARSVLDGSQRNRVEAAARARSH